MAVSFKADSDHNIAKIVLIGVLLVAAVAGLMILVNHYFIQKALVQKEPLTILLLGTGSDSGSGSVSKTLAANDAMVLVFCNPAASRISFLSIPRGKQGISGMSQGSASNPEQTSNEVSQWVGVPINRYLAVDQQGFKELVDVLGGITVDIPVELHYRDRWGRDLYRFASGRQVLDGEKALIYVKLTESSGDELGRVQRQQEFLKAVLKKARNQANILRVAEYNSIIRKYLKTDIKFEEMLKIGNFLKEIDSGNLDAYVLPGRENNGVWEPDRSSLAELLRKLEP